MTAMQMYLRPDQFDEAQDYEKAAFGQLEIKAAGQLLTALIRTEDGVPRYDLGPYVSGYHLAEWLAWNWWRLRWEPPHQDRKPSFNWEMTHRMTAIGEGYRWPNITISSDGFHCMLTAERTDQTDTPFLFYLGAHDDRPVAVPAADFEAAVDEFIKRVLQLMSDADVFGTNLQKLWNDLSEERSDPELTRFRRIEALLGFDPDEADERLIYTRLEEAQLLGATALEELATGAGDNMLSAKQITDTTASVGFDMKSSDALRLDHPIGIPWGQTAAWRVGVTAAYAVRQQAGLADRPIPDSRLADLAGISPDVITSDQCTNSLSWVFHHTPECSRVALRGRRQTGRRFDIARLIGDQIFSEGSHKVTEPLAPATRSHSYRQKAQRAFAAELLSPWERVRDMLDDDYSPENQEQVAEHFAVSPLTINTLVANNECSGTRSALERQT